MREQSNKLARGNSRADSRGKAAVPRRRDAKETRNYVSESNRRAHSQKGYMKWQRLHSNTRQRETDKHDGKLAEALCPVRRDAGCRFHGGLNHACRVNRLRATRNEN